MIPIDSVSRTYLFESLSQVKNSLPRYTVNVRNLAPDTFSLLCYNEQHSSLSRTGNSRAFDRRNNDSQQENTTPPPVMKQSAGWHMVEEKPQAGRGKNPLAVRGEKDISSTDRDDAFEYPAHCSSTSWAAFGSFLVFFQTVEAES